MSAESDPLFTAEHEPTRALLLAQALEACIQAERRAPGSAGHVIARQPAWARAELRRLVSLAGALDAVAARTVISDEFRAAARARLMHRIAPERHAGLALAAPNGHAVPAAVRLTSAVSRKGHLHARASRRRWFWRGGIGGLLAAGLLAAATLTASANALPGEPLYSVKQVREEIGLRLAPDDQARALVLLNEADMRLDETARLLQEGRTDEVAQTTQRFDDALDRATTTYVVTIDEAPEDPLPDVLEARLAQQQQQLQSLLASAPEPARADLREALVATERSRALVAEPQPIERRGSRSSSAAAAATAAVEVWVEPTSVPEDAEASGPPPVDIVSQAMQRDVADLSDRAEGRGVDASAASDVATTVVTHVNRPVVIPPRPAVLQDKKLEMHLDQVDDARGVPPAQVDADAGVVAAPQAADPRADGQHDNAANQRGPETTVAAVDAHDQVVAPSANQNDAHDRVAEQPAAQPQTSAVMTQRQSANNDSHGGSPAQNSAVVADTSAANAGSGRGAAVSHDDAGQAHQQPTQSVTARTPRPTTVSASASNGGDKRPGASTTPVRTDAGNHTPTASTSSAGANTTSGEHADNNHQGSGH